MLKYFKKLLFFIFVTILFSCGNSISNDESYKNGSLVLTLNSDFERVITPDIDMEITTYVIEGFGPYRQTFSVEQSSNETLFIQEDLREGTWNITVTGENSNETIVGSGTTSVEISQLSYTESTVTIEPVSGTGTLDITISFPEEDVLAPTLTAFLVAQEDIANYVNPEVEVNTTDILFNQSEIDFSYNSLDNQFANGYYLLVLTLEDEDKIIWTSNDLVRIVTNETTAVTNILTIDDLNQLEGNMTLAIKENMLSPLDVALNFDYTPTIDDGTDYGITATFMATSDATTYLWILDGTYLDSTNNRLFLSNLTAERVYELTVIASDGQLIGSASMSFKGSDYINNYPQ